MWNFSSSNVDKEVERVWNVCMQAKARTRFNLEIPDEELCREFLYHFVILNRGIFNTTPILHLHHTDLPLVVGEWTPEIRRIFYTNGSLLIATDAELQLPRGLWIRSRTLGPLFHDAGMHYYVTRYHHRKKIPVDGDGFVLDVFKAERPPYQGADGFVSQIRMLPFSFKMIRIHNPTLFDYRKRRSYTPNSVVGPILDPPDPFIWVPEGIPVPADHGAPAIN